MFVFQVWESKVKIIMDVKKKEMDLLSNSIAAYAHIKGKTHNTIPTSTCVRDFSPNNQVTAVDFCSFLSKPRELRPLLCARGVFRPGADALPPRHPHLLQAADQRRALHTWEKTLKGHQRGGRGERGRWGWRRGGCGGTRPIAQHRNPCR